ncbi:nucleolar RNA helicase 2 isoform X1 [Pristis pectinata]|uniref:nucleolar RNA helicase 2 isoform X1 n=1 Tax=Pristis pectinata TaxID=685728 RepID=UPI00223D0170|nr:nucleolar RNA helicase 2 isoform X1 [Pristis pectinata]
MPARLSCQPEDPEPGMEVEPVKSKEHKRHKKDKEKRKHSEENMTSGKKSKCKENGVHEEHRHSTDESDLKPPKSKKYKLAKDDCDGNAERKNKREEKNGLVKDSQSEAVPCSSDDSIQCSEGEVEEELSLEQREGAFSNFRISQETIKLLKARGVTHLFPIQAQTFDHIYDGSDCVAQARTGTGKTFSFAIPLVEKLQLDLTEQRRGRPPKVLVLAPTRELAIQVAKDFKDITRKLAVSCFYGGTAYNGQMDSIRNGIDILVGTPGRVRDHLQNMKINLSKLKHVVLDEVDQMLDMGFAEQVEDILSVAYKKDSKDNPQTLLFSATCPPWVYEVARKYMKDNYKQVDLIGKRTQRAATTVEHLAITCHWSERPSVIADIIQVYSGSHGRTIVFCETKKEVNELVMNNSLKQEAQCLHGDIPQKTREATLKGFRDGSFEVLVATNVAARGLDIPEVDLVIQNCPPKDVDSYIHRSGRTGRAGRTGVCICLYQRKEAAYLRSVELKAGLKFKHVGVPTAAEIIKASCKDAIRSLDSVPASVSEHFRAAAEKLIEKRGALDALAAALAHISGAKSFEQRSLLNSEKGYTTMVLECSVEMHNIGFAWRGLKEQLGETVENQVKGMQFLKGKMGVCFDVPQDAVESIKGNWQDSRRWKLTIANELPELENDRIDRASDFRKHSSRSQNWRGMKRNYNSMHRAW